MLNVGRKNSRVLAALHEQVDRTVHECFHVAMYPGYVELAEALNRVTPGDHPKKTMLANSGAEAVENAVKIARYATGRQSVVCFSNGFSGRTLMGMTLTAKEMPYKRGMGPFAPDVHRVPFPYSYRPPMGTTETVGAACAEQLAHVIDSELGADRVACVVIEPVQGEGGYIVTPQDFMTELRNICSERGIILIADEIQSGMGRTARMFAMDHYDVVPDMVTTAKSLGAGLPISGVTGPADVMEAPHVGGLGGTYGGNPLGCAAALAVIEELESTDLLQRAEKLGQTIRARLEPLAEELALVGEVRGLGPMIGVELVSDKTTKEPAKLAAAAVVKRCHDNGVLIMKCGTHDNVVRLMPPLVIGEEDLDSGLDVLAEALRWAEQGTK